MVTKANRHGITKSDTSKAEIWNRNHERIRNAMKDLNRLEFSTPELHQRMLSMGMKMSSTRLRTHLDGYAPKKYGRESRRPPGCKTFIEEGFIQTVDDGRRLKFRMVDFAHRSRVSQLLRVLNRYRSFDEFNYDPGVFPPNRAYKKDELLRTCRINFPRGIDESGALLEESSKREGYGSLEQKFMAYIIRRVFLRFAHAIVLDSLPDKSFSPSSLGVLEWLLRKRKGKFPKKGLTALAGWLQLATSSDWWENKALFVVEVDLQRMIQLLTSEDGVRCLSGIFNDRDFKETIRYRLSFHRNSLAAERDHTLPKLLLHAP